MSSEDSPLFASSLGDLTPYEIAHSMAFTREDQPLLGSLMWMSALCMDGMLVLDRYSRVTGGITPLEAIRALGENLNTSKKGLLRITVSDVARPVPTLELNDMMGEALEELVRSKSYLAVVSDGSRSIGVLSPNSLHKALMSHPLTRALLKSLDVDGLTANVRTLALDSPLGEVARLISRSRETLFKLDEGELVVTPSSLLKLLSSPEAVNMMLEDTRSFLDKPLINFRSTLIGPPTIRKGTTLYEALKAAIESGVCAVRVDGAGFLTAESLFFGIVRALLAAREGF
ncbi:MAG: CBS domain-containing protein [Thaumarchaeota archaeon]|nr:CBS domain-containing protein [Candidatus Calditenuaceae archaeon]MDW8186797.1 CBS domain-containing protein [Nitrososphaerota archaeon]